MVAFDASLARNQRADGTAGAIKHDCEKAPVAMIVENQGNLPAEEASEPKPHSRGLGMSRTKSLFSMVSEVSLTSLTTASSCAGDSHDADHDPHEFSRALREHTHGKSCAPTFDSSTRNVMEPYLRHARSMREKTRQAANVEAGVPIASTVGVPYPELRQERPFLYDTHTHPLHDILAQTLQVEDLSKVHESPLGTSLLVPLMDTRKREAFHNAYVGFVRSFCIPLLHEIAMSKRLFHSSTPPDCITYRYQAFPGIEIHKPQTEHDRHHRHRSTKKPSCEVSDGRSIGYLRFHVPLTPCFGTNALFTESYPGREDWHPLEVKSPGVGYLFDGARCIHFDMDNTTDKSRVSLEFRVLMYRNDGPVSTSRRNSTGSPVVDLSRDHGVFTPPSLVEDAQSRAGPGHYEETCIECAYASVGSSCIKACNHGRPSPRCCHSFDG